MRRQMLIPVVPDSVLPWRLELGRFLFWVEVVGRPDGRLHACPGVMLLVRGLVHSGSIVGQKLSSDVHACFSWVVLPCWCHPV